MSDIGEQPIESRTTRRRTVADVVELSDQGVGFAYVPGEVLVRRNAASRLRELTRTDDEREEDAGRSDEELEALLDELFPPVAAREDLRGGRGWRRATGVDRPLELIEVLRSEGYDAQPNHVMFVHGCGSPCPPHPALVHALAWSGLLANPMGANPMGANPMGANPMGANPMGANPMGANPMGANPVENTAIPVKDPSRAPRQLQGPGPHPHIVVLDTGLAGGADTSTRAVGVAAIDHRPPFLMAATSIHGLPGERDLPDTDIELRTGGLERADNYLDPVAGHGTFIAGIIEHLAPGCTIEVRRVIYPLGDAVESEVADAIETVVENFKNATHTRPWILSLSFGGPAPVPPGHLREAVAKAVNAGIAVIASAGNDGVCTPQYPAALPGVIAVAALGPDGPPVWTNYGDWVDACAPGVNLVSAFFDRFDGAFPTMNTYDPDRFTGWAKWSGTSFAVPVVVAAVARELVCGPAVDGDHSRVDRLAAAIDRVVRAPHLLRLPCLGTVVNI